jgi:hypothetical protein
LLLGGDSLQVTASLGGNQKALDTLALAELDGPLAHARQAALLAVLRVESLEDSGRKDSDEWKQAATETAAAQRASAFLEGRRNLLAAQQALHAAPEKGRADAVKKVAEAEKALAKAEADAQQPVTTAYTPRPIPKYPPTSTGRRLAFARWIADRNNPLAARVAVNQMWMRHFGQPLVPSVFDFGRNGRPPSHPELLDWLAAEFMERGWSMKDLHRLLVTSNAYCMASTPDDADLAADRDNVYLWRMNSRRMEAEVVRDCVFAVAGTLDLTMGGPELDQNLALKAPRRSLYLRHAQEKQAEFMKIFDTAAVTECYRRKESIVPQQALALANSELTRQHARVLGRKLADTVGSDPGAFVTAAFERVLSRAPTGEERSECVAFLEEQTRRNTEGQRMPMGTDAATPALRARQSLVHVLLNHHYFVTIR